MLSLGAALVASGVAVTQIASAETPTAAAAQSSGGLSVSPAIFETTARTGASGTVTITNTTSKTLKMTVRARPWRQSKTGAVAADRRRTLSAVRVSASGFTLAAGASRTVTVRMSRVPSARSQYGALDAVGKPTKKRKGINVAYRLVSSLRFNPTASARRLRLKAGSASTSGKGSSRSLLLGVTNRGNTVEPVGGTVSITGGGGGRSGAVTPVRIIPGKRVNVRLASLAGFSRGSYKATVTLSQAGRNVLTTTKSFRIR
jgi:hypothetical protein